MNTQQDPLQIGRVRHPQATKFWLVFPFADEPCFRVQGRDVSVGRAVHMTGWGVKVRFLTIFAEE